MEVGLQDILDENLIIDHPPSSIFSSEKSIFQKTHLDLQILYIFNLIHIIFTTSIVALSRLSHFDHSISHLMAQN